MLVLTRKTDQKIRIGKDIVITILEVRKNQISIGIEAPQDVLITREEIDPELKKAVISQNQKSALNKHEI